MTIESDHATSVSAVCLCSFLKKSSERFTISIVANVVSRNEKDAVLADFGIEKSQLVSESAGHIVETGRNARGQPVPMDIKGRLAPGMNPSKSAGYADFNPLGFHPLCFRLLRLEQDKCKQQEDGRDMFLPALHDELNVVERHKLRKIAGMTCLLSCLALVFRNLS